MMAMRVKSSLSSKVKYLSSRMASLDRELESDVVTHGKELETSDTCIFCKIIQGKEEANIVFKNSEVTVFYDIRPASTEHLLIVPNCHVGNPKTLKKDDVPMVEYLHRVGRSVLETKGASMENTRCGFHWPPFNSVQHLHLHMIYPENEMGMVARFFYKLNSMWFVAYDWMLDRLKTMPDAVPLTQSDEAVAASASDNTAKSTETSEESKE